MWGFLWICWANQCCCCDFLHAKQYRLLAFWVAIVFYFGMIACCISGYVFVYRFKVDLAGATCAFEKLYWDMKEGQLRKEYPKWDGLNSIGSKLVLLSQFIEKLMNLDNEGNTLYTPGDDWKEEDNLIGSREYIDAIKRLKEMINGKNIKYSLSEGVYELEEETGTDLNITFFSYYIDTDNIAAPNTFFGKIMLEIREKINPYITKLKSAQEKINDLILNANSYINSLKNVSSDINAINSDWDKFRPYILDNWDYYRKVTKAFFYIVLLIYFILVLILAIAGISFLVGYVCLKDQKLMRSILVIIWNAVKFFSFSFFMYGGTFGMLSYAFKDGIGFMNYAFGAENLNSEKPMIIPNGTSIPMLKYCLLGNKTNFINNFNLDILLIESLENLYTELNKIISYDSSSIEINLLSVKEVSKKIDEKTDINNLMNESSTSAITEILNDINRLIKNCTNGDTWYPKSTDCNNVKNKVTETDLRRKINTEVFKKSLCSPGNDCCVPIDKVYKIINQENIKYIYTDCNETTKDNIIFLINLYDEYENIKKTIDDYQNSIKSIVNSMGSDISETINKISVDFKKSLESFSDDAITYGGIFSFMDCAFLKYDLNIIFEVFTSLSSRSRSLCGITCSLACFGCVTVYFSLFCIYHYDKERFKDLKHEKLGGLFDYNVHNKKNNKKNPLIDNQYKKNKEKEIELTSRISIEDTDNSKIDSRSKRK